MFGKKCDRCGNKIGKDFGFCPYCGTQLRDIEKDKKDYGFLGKDDFMNFPGQNLGVKMPFGFGMLFNSLLKEVDKQFKDLDKQTGEETGKIKTGAKIDEKRLRIPFNRAGGISISIATETGKSPLIKVKSFSNAPEFVNIEKEIARSAPEKTGKIYRKRIDISEEQARKLSKLPREEAETKVRRLSNKIIYEINLPGVKSIKDVMINKLENSIEIKAFAKDRVFFKLLPISLPVIRHKLEGEKLILELRPEG